VSISARLVRRQSRSRVQRPETPDEKETTMRFMMMVKIPATITESEYSPDAETVAKMAKYNEELTKAGVLLALDGLHPPEKGARIEFAGGGKTTVTDGPYTEAKEIVGGYWIIDVRSKDEALEWATRAPMGDGGVIELRQVFEMTDFPADVQEAAGELSQQPPEQTVARG
jgi:hypothetical protein